MGWKSNQVQRLSVGLLTLFIASLDASQNSVNQSIKKHQSTFENVAMDIWDLAEVGYQEYKSSEILINVLKKNGFKITTGVADIPTAFIAEYSNGGPVIGILGEYDALPGVMQTSSPFKETRADRIAGHACGHHMFGAASAWAAVTIKEWIEKTNTPGTIRFYGTPAEEGGSGKVYMVREGLLAAEGAAIGTDTKVTYEIMHGNYSLLPNDAIQKVMYQKLTQRGGISYDKNEKKYAEKIYQTLVSPSGKIGDQKNVLPYRETHGYGSTDVGDISWVVPTGGVRIATWVPGTSAHSWQAVAAGGTSIGLKGTKLAAEILSETAIELLLDTSLIDQAKEELRIRTGDKFQYEPLLGNREPPLDYRN